MPDVKQPTKEAPKAPQVPQLPVKCRVVEQPDGAMQVQFLVDPDAAKRIRSRAQGMPLERFIYENILYRAVMDAVY